MNGYILMILSSSPLLSSSFEQGLELALNFADAEYPVRVLLSEDMAQSLACCADDSDYAKKLRQLELYEIKTYAQIPVCLEFAKTADLRELMEKAKNILVF